MSDFIPKSVLAQMSDENVCSPDSSKIDIDPFRERDEESETIERSSSSFSLELKKTAKFFSRSPFKRKTKNESFILLVANIGEEQIIKEFSHPIDVKYVEEWSGLYDVWFHQIPIDLSNANWIERTTVRADMNRSVRHYQLEEMCCYFVCGFTFDEDEDIPVYIPPKENARILDFQTLAQIGSPNEAEFFLEMFQFNIERALIEFFSSNPILPFDFSSGLELGYMNYGFSNKDEYSTIYLDSYKSIEQKISALLLVAARDTQLSRLRLLLKLPFIKKTFRDDNGRHVLHYAAKDGNPVVIKLLLEHEEIISLINVPDNKDETCLRFAIIKNSLDFVVAIKNLLIERKMPLYQSNDKRTLLSLAAKETKVNIVKELLEIPDIKNTSKSGYPAIVYSGYRTSIEMARMILERFPECINDHSNSQSLGEEHALIAASINKNHNSEKSLELVKFLVSKGADINLKDEYDKTALHYALDNGEIGIATFLLSLKGIETDIRSKKGRTPMEIACQRGYYDIITIMKCSRGNLNEQNPPLNNTMLIDAVFHRKEDLCRGLIERGINVTARNIFGRSAAYESIVQGVGAIYLLLENNGVVKYEEKDIDGIALKNANNSLTTLKTHPFRHRMYKDQIKAMNKKRFRVKDENGGEFVQDCYGDLFSSSLKKEPKKVIERFQTLLKEAYFDVRDLRQRMPAIFINDDFVQSVVAPSCCHFSFEGEFYVEYPVLYNSRVNYFPYGMMASNNFLYGQHNNDFYNYSLMDEMNSHHPENNKDFSSMNTMLKRVDCVHQLLYSLLILHHLNIYHRNIRLTSVLKDERGNIQVIGFGNRLIMKLLKERKKDSYISPSFKEERHCKWEKFEANDDIYSLCQICYKVLYENLYREPKKLEVYRSMYEFTSILMTILENRSKISIIFLVKKLEELIPSLLSEFVGEVSEQKNVLDDEDVFERKAIEAQEKYLEEKSKEWTKKMKTRQKSAYQFLFDKKDLHEDSIFYFNDGNERYSKLLSNIKKTMKNNDAIQNDDIQNVQNFIKKQLSSSSSSSLKKKKKQEELPEFIPTFLNVLIDHCSKNSDSDFLLVIVELIKILTVLPCFVEFLISTQKGEELFESLIRYNKEKTKEKVNIQLLKIACNLCNTRNGVAFIFNHDILQELFTISSVCLQKESNVPNEVALSFFQHISKYSHLTPKNMDVFCEEIFKKMLTIWFREKGHVGNVQKLLWVFYQFLCFNGSAKKFVVSRCNKMELLNFFKMLENLIDIRMKKKDKKDYRILVLSLSAHFLSNEDFEQYKRTIFSKAKKFADPFQKEEKYDIMNYESHFIPKQEEQDSDSEEEFSQHDFLHGY